LPKFLKDKKAIVNVNNKDNRCFGFSILAALYHDHLPTHLQLRKSRPGTYKCLFTQHGLDKLAYPVGIEDVAEIEKQIGIGINIFSYSDDKGVDRYPIYISKFWYNCETQGPQKTTVDLLYFENHWAAITNFSRFMADKKTKQTDRLWCKQCLCSFTKEEYLVSHLCKHPDVDDTIRKIVKITNNEPIGFFINPDSKAAEDVNRFALQQAKKT